MSVSLVNGNCKNVPLKITFILIAAIISVQVMI